jgi:hypothetical protein
MSEVIPLINGTAYSWASIRFNIAGIDTVAVTAIEYSEDEMIENVYGAGKYPVERTGEGKIEPKAKITLLMSALELLRGKSITGRLPDLGIFDITVAFQKTNGIRTKHIIKNAQFKGDKVSVKEGDTKIEADIDLLISHIVWK